MRPLFRPFSKATFLSSAIPHTLLQLVSLPSLWWRRQTILMHDGRYAKALSFSLEPMHGTGDHPLQRPHGKQAEIRYWRRRFVQATSADITKRLGIRYIWPEEVEHTLGRFTISSASRSYRVDASRRRLRIESCQDVFHADHLAWESVVFGYGRTIPQRGIAL